MLSNTGISPLEKLLNHPGSSQGISLFIKRDDLLHPEIEGSKGRKLAAVFPLDAKKYPGGLLSFGGAYSNHLHAVAKAGKLYGTPTTGVLRGEYADFQNPTLRVCQENGMKLVPIPKVKYDALQAEGPEAMRLEFPDCYILPEGGNTPQAVATCAIISDEILSQLPLESLENPLYCCVPAGTGCTAAGVISGMEAPNARVLVFPVSNHGFGPETILKLLPSPEAMEARFELVTGYTFGGFAKLHLPLMAFARRFFQETNIRLDPVYTSKMCFGVYDLLGKDFFEPGSTIVLLHTGGMQGWEGFRQRFGDVGSL